MDQPFTPSRVLMSAPAMDRVRCAKLHSSVASMLIKGGEFCRPGSVANRRDNRHILQFEP